MDQRSFENLSVVGDPYMLRYPLMSSVYPTLLGVLLFFGICSRARSLMKNVEPFDVKRWMILYNAVSVFLSIYLTYGMFWGYLEGSWVLFSNCEPIDYNDHSDTANNGRWMCYVYFLTKFSEFCDTFFFILRKKFSHLSFLHVIHHGLMPLNSWFFAKYVPGSLTSLTGGLNSLVHIFMYAYYLAMALGPRWQRIAAPWKKSMTTLQLVQFYTMFAFCCLYSWYGEERCRYPKIFLYITAFNAMFFTVLFTNFYFQQYTKKEESAPSVAAGGGDEKKTD